LFAGCDGSVQLRCNDVEVVIEQVGVDVQRHRRAGVFDMRVIWGRWA
jgi:hypothetical protein